MNDNTDETLFLRPLTKNLFWYLEADEQLHAARWQVDRGSHPRNVRE